MKHDIERNGCEALYGEYQHIMSPQLSADASPIVWSNCSRKAITKFLDRDWGYCLMDEPAIHDFDFPEMPPGAMYDTDHQCRLQYGQDAMYCEGIDEICATLWCQKDNKCLTRLEAPAEGTLCDVNMWCERGKCIAMGEEIPDAINGNWGEWGEWSTCSRTCGAGVTVMERHCDNPGPSNGGRYCLGDRKRYRTCSTDPCDEGAPTFRQVQCASFNDILYKNKHYEWEPVSDTTNPCQLRCKPRGKFFSVLMRDIVEDGTPCRPSRDMCINGLCRRVGCDWGIESNATEDRCGVCHGDGLSCTTVKEEFNDAQGFGYVEAMVIPAGARNIRVQEVAEANNYLAVCNDKGKFFLNGHWVINWSGDFDAGGTTIHYTRDGHKESFNAAGPLKEPLHIMLLFQSQNPGIAFEFTVPKENATATRIPEFKWARLDWTHCTSSCGGGYQRSEVVCLERDSGHVDSHFCNQTTKPDDESRRCNEHQCPSRWWTGPWQLCSATCGGGVHRRTVICTRMLKHDEQIALDDSECEGADKPAPWEACRHTKPCPAPGDAGAARRPEWTAGPWSKTCLGDPCDMQTRKVMCSDRNAICDVHNTPPGRRPCSTATCGKWLTAAWTKCSKSCGSGIKRRQVQCVGGQHCHRDKIPSEREPCSNGACPTNTTAAATTTPELTTTSAARTTTTTTTMTPLTRTSMTTMTVTTTMPRTSSTAAATKPPLITSTIAKQLSTDDQQQYADAKYNSIEKDQEDIDKGVKEKEAKQSTQKEGGEGTQPKLNPDFVEHEISVVNKDISNVKEKNQTAPTHPSIMSTPFKYFKSWLGLGEHQEEEEEEVGGQEGAGVEGNWQSSSRPYRWVYASTTWSECSVLCGGGDQVRTLSCVNLGPSGGRVEDSYCQPIPKPIYHRPCNSFACSQWTSRDWSKCSVTCGEGRQTREVRCKHGSAPGSCDQSRRPASTRVCSNAACVDWVTGDWSQCSMTCGGGEQIRNVQCIDHSTMWPANGCHPYTKPTSRQKCSREACLHHSAALMGYSKHECRSNIMSYHLCRQLKRQGRCSNKLIQYRCCRTCHSRPDIPNSPPTT